MCREAFVLDSAVARLNMAAGLVQYFSMQNLARNCTEKCREVGCRGKNKRRRPPAERIEGEDNSIEAYAALLAHSIDAGTSGCCFL